MKRVKLSILLSLFVWPILFGQQVNEYLLKVEEEITKTLEKDEIPGMSLVIVKDGKSFIKNYGFADIDAGTAIDNNTVFELGSCSKAFTALAILKLESQGKLDLNDKVSSLIPGFRQQFGEDQVQITLKQALFHTSGISWQTLSNIAPKNSDAALQLTIESIYDVPLNRMPGSAYEYATINYDILGRVIEVVTGRTYEAYITEEILKPLKMHSSSVGIPKKGLVKSDGHKMGYFSPRTYDAPVYRGNYPAGYVLTTAEDLEKWLRNQLGLIDNELMTLITKSHTKDLSVAPRSYDLSSYAFGWNVPFQADGAIYHEGMNPNFTSYVTFNKSKQLAVGVLANSSSALTMSLGKNIMHVLSGDPVDKHIENENNDPTLSVVSIIFAIYLLGCLLYLLKLILDVSKGKRHYSFGKNAVKQLVASTMISLLLLYAVYLIPYALAGFSWSAALVWTPFSFTTLMATIVLSIVLSYITFVFTVFYAGTSSYKSEVPTLSVISILSGVANMAIVVLISMAISQAVPTKYVLFYFGIVFLLYIGGRKVVQTRLVNITNGIIYELRIKLLQKIFATSYQKFEKIDRGRIYTTLNDDTGTLGNAANVVISIITSLITVIGAFCYMATISLWATLSTIGVILLIATFFYFISQKADALFEQARDTGNIYMRLLNGLIDGYKELSSHWRKKNDYKSHLESTSSTYRDKLNLGQIKFVNAFLVGESLLVMVLATVAFAIPVLFPTIKDYKLMNFVIVLLYLIGPINMILLSAPEFVKLKVAWFRIQNFIKDIPNENNYDEKQAPSLDKSKALVASIELDQVAFKYDENDDSGFKIGPLNLKAEQGEVIFIIGGNGSGKTTLAKLLVGLYSPISGKINIDGKPVTSSELGEHFSTIYNPLYLFDKLYGVDIQDKENLIKEYLELLDLDHKVAIENGIYSTLKISAGQKKRLALLQSFLEDKPIYLFDEWAADQDPQYRNFFYNKILPKLKKQGKIVIAITHDDHYFHCADKVLKMDLGKIHDYDASLVQEKEKLAAKKKANDIQMLAFDAN